MSGDGSDSTALVGIQPAQRRQWRLCNLCIAVLGTSKTDKAFASGFKALAHFPVGIYSAEAYDAANTIIAELKILSSGKTGTMAITRANVVKGLHKIVFKGLTKTISFQANGNILGTDIYVNQVQHGNLVQLGLE